MRFLQPKSNLQLTEHQSCQPFWKRHAGLHFTKEAKKKGIKNISYSLKDCEAFV